MNWQEKKKIDYLIATKVMGWSNITKSGKVSAVTWFDASGSPQSKIRDYRPTEDIAQSINLLNEFESYTLAASTDGHMCELWQDQDVVADTEAETMALAICLAVIDALDIQLQDVSVADDLLRKDIVPANGKMHTNCGRCNRPLRSIESQRRGYGPECWKKEGEEPNLITLLTDQQQLNFMDELEERRELAG